MKISLEKEGKNRSEIINEIKAQLNLSIVGMIPVQLLEKPSKAKKPSKTLNKRKELNIKINSGKSIESNFDREIKKFLNSSQKEKRKLFLLEDNYGQKLIIKSKNILQIFILFNNENNENKNNILTRGLWTKKQLKLLPLSKMICQLSLDIFLSCRYLDKIIHINYMDKKNI